MPLQVSLEEIRQNLICQLHIFHQFRILPVRPSGSKTMMRIVLQRQFVSARLSPITNSITDSLVGDGSTYKVLAEALLRERLLLDNVPEVVHDLLVLSIAR
jgi:hypothetical protein